MFWYGSTCNRTSQLQIPNPIVQLGCHGLNNNIAMSWLKRMGRSVALRAIAWVMASIRFTNTFNGTDWSRSRAAVTVWYPYNAVNFITNIHKRHPMARPLGRGMGCLLWIQHLIDLISRFLQLLVQNPTIFDRVITALDCIRASVKSTMNGQINYDTDIGRLISRWFSFWLCSLSNICMDTIVRTFNTLMTILLVREWST